MILLKRAKQSLQEYENENNILKARIALLETPSEIQEILQRVSIEEQNWCCIKTTDLQVEWRREQDIQSIVQLRQDLDFPEVTPPLF